MSQPPTRHHEEEPKPPRVRPRWLYRVAFLLAAGDLVWAIAAGRFSHFRPFTPGATPPPADFPVGDLLGFVLFAPLLFLAYDLGSQHTTARRLGTAVWRGFVECWRVAWTRVDPRDRAYDFDQAPDDDSITAILMGFGVAAMFPTIFLTAAPPLRTTRGIVWLVGAGVIMGIMAYCYRRAAAYLKDDPSPWNFFRGWSRLNPERYSPEGRVFVWIQIVGMLVMMVWWLGGGALMIGSGGFPGPR